MLRRSSNRGPIRRPFAALAALALVAVTAAPVAAAPPSNDSIATPIVIPGIPYTTSQDTSEATTGPTDPDCAGTGPTVWYSFTATGSARLAATTFGSDYDTTLAVGTPDGGGGIDLIDCNDDAGGTLQSAVAVETDPGETYLFMVGSFASGPGGNLVFNLDVAPPAPTVELTVARTGSFGSDGSATLRGTVACTGDVSFVELFGSARQRVGRFSIQGFGNTFLEGCSETPTAWELNIQGENGLFAGGPAQVVVEAFACGILDCGSDLVEGTVRLRS
jgi:hypothetical protein